MYKRQPSFQLDPGQVASFQNISSSQHDVTATGKGPDGEALFVSETIFTGTTPVNGTQYLSSGSYQFFCTIHPEMRSDLVVGSAGTPVARPDVELKVLSTKLDKVLSSGKLKVKVTAPTLSSDIALSAQKGARKLGSKGNLDLTAGSSRTVKLKLTAAGENVLEDLNSAKVKVTGSVPFGAPDTAKRKLK